MSMCFCGLFHPECERGRRGAAIAKAARGDQRCVDANAATERAWIAKQAGRDLPLKQYDELDKAWRRASDAARAVSSEVWREKAAEYDSAVPT